MCRIPLIIAAYLLGSQVASAAEPPPVLTLKPCIPNAPAAQAPVKPVPPPRKILTLQTPEQTPPALPLIIGPPPPTGEASPASMRWEPEIPRHELALQQAQPSAFDRLLDQISKIFDPQDIEGPLGTLSTVHILPPVEGNHRFLPFFSLGQDADELDAHLRLGAGAGMTYRIDPLTSLNAEVHYLESAGDVNPATSSETRFMLTFTRKF